MHRIKRYMWTILLFLIIGLDCLVTIHVGFETNPILCFLMTKTNCNLTELMFLKAYCSMPLVFIAYETNVDKLIAILYLLIYTIGVVVQFV